MGYTLKIGEARIDWHEEGVSVDCEVVRLDTAPAYGEPTDYTSARWPSYSGWANAMEKLGLMDVMFNESNHGKGYFEWNGETRYPLIQEHPGASPITREHVEYVNDRLEKYKAAHPDHRAEYPPPKEGTKPLMGNLYRDEDLVSDPRYDSALCRGEWLLFWLAWAVDNCEQPVFVNS